MKLRRKTSFPRIPAPTYNVRRSRQRDYGAGCRHLLVDFGRFCDGICFLYEATGAGGL
jgi:hypothetical protein